MTIQIVDVINAPLSLPDWFQTVTIVLFVIGFPIALILAWAYEVTPEGIKPDFGTQAKAQAPAQQNQLLIYATFALVLLVAGFQLSEVFFSGNVSTATRSVEPALTTTDSAVLRASIILNQPLRRIPTGIRTVLSVAPNGTALAYSDFNNTGGRVFLRNLATQQTQEIFSEIGVAQFSPSGQQLLLYAGPGGTSVMPAQGGGLRSLPIETLAPPSWLSDETVIYPHTDGIKIFSLTDGTDELIPGFDNSALFVFTYPLPNDSAFLFTQGGGTSGAQSSSSILAYDLSNQSSKPITNDGYYPQYVNSGHVVFIRAGDLWAVPFDPDALEVTGTETIVLEGVDSQPLVGIGAYSASDSGRLVYLPGREYLPDQTVLVWADRLGNRTELPLRAGNYEEPRLSPNGELLALTSFQPDGSSDIWVHDFSSGTFNPVTFSGNARNPVWTPDGSQLVYQLNTTVLQNRPRGELWIMNADGTGQAERILDGDAKTDSFSPIDEKLIYMTGLPGTDTGISLNTLTLSDGA